MSDSHGRKMIVRYQFRSNMIMTTWREGRLSRGALRVDTTRLQRDLRCCTIKFLLLQQSYGEFKTRTNMYKRYKSYIYLLHLN